MQQKKFLGLLLTLKKGATMTQRKKLIELIHEFGFSGYEINDLADYLIANGVVVLPCKVGDTVFINTADSHIPTMCTVQGVYFTLRGNYVRLYPLSQPKQWLGNRSCYYKVSLSSLGKTLFITLEEAKAALKEKIEVTSDGE